MQIVVVYTMGDVRKNWCWPSRVDKIWDASTRVLIVQSYGWFYKEFRLLCKILSSTLYLFDSSIENQVFDSSQFH